MSTALSARTATDNTSLRSLASSLAALDEIYTDFTTDVRLVQAREVQGKLVARIEETTKLHYARVHGDEPAYTAFQVEREFVFKKGTKGLVLEDVQYTGEGLPPINEPIHAEPTEPTEPNQPAGVNLGVESSPLPAAEAPLDGTLIGSAKTSVTSAPGVAGYNYSAMVRYATTYWSRYNPAYRSFASDCTNFISQAHIPQYQYTKQVLA